MALLAQNFPGMELIPLIFLVVASAPLLGLAALVSAFFNRRRARALARATAAMAAAYPFLIVVANRGNVSWVPAALAAAVMPTCAVVAALGLAALGAFIPLEHGPRAVGDSRTVTRNRRLIAVLVGTPSVGMIAWGAFSFAESQAGEHKTRALLAGDAQVRLRSVRVHYQMRRVVCTDPETLRYLEKCFRHHDPNRTNLGTTYTLTLEYEGGGRDTLTMYWWGDEGMAVTIGERGEGGTTYGVPLPRPRPRSVDAVAAYLSAPWQEVMGYVLVVSPEGVWLEPD